MRDFVKLALSGLMVGIATAVHATPITLSASGTSAAGDPIAASVTFDVSGTNLMIVLTNNSLLNSSYAPPDALLGLFFTTAGNLSLVPSSAVLTAGSSVLGSFAAGDSLGDYWQYKFSAGGFSNGILSTADKYGISATGAGGMFGPSGNFASGPAANLNGVDGAIVGIDFSDAAANGGMKISGHGPFEQTSVTFSLSGLPILFDPSTAISGVTFIYGTAPDSLLATCPGFCGHQQTDVPEPASMALFGTGILGLLGLAKRRGSKRASRAIS